MIAIHKEVVITIDVKDSPDIKKILVEPEIRAINAGHNILVAARALRGRAMKDGKDVPEELMADITNSDYVSVRKSVSHITATDKKILESWMDAVEVSDQYDIINVGDRFIVKQGDTIINQAVYSHFTGGVTNAFKDYMVGYVGSNMSSDDMLSDGPPFFVPDQSFPGFIHHIDNSVFPVHTTLGSTPYTKVKVFITFMFVDGERTILIENEKKSIGILADITLMDIINSSRPYSVPILYSAVERIAKKEVKGKESVFIRKEGTLTKGDELIVFYSVWLYSNDPKIEGRHPLGISKIDASMFEDIYSKKLIQSWGINDKKD